MDRGEAVSGAAFEGLPPHQAGEESYEPGACGFDRTLVEWLISLYDDEMLLIMDSNRMQSLFREYADLFTRELGEVAGSGFNANLFLDAVVRGIGEHLEESGCESRLTYLGHLLDPLVQALYDLGHNDFTIDCDALPCYPDSLGYYLGGEESRRLRAAYRADPGYFGHKTAHCDLTLVGNAFRLGTFSKWSGFSIEGEAHQVAHYSSHCSYRLRAFQCLSVTSEMPSDCEFRISQKMTPGRMRRLKGDNFFRQGNTILVPDGSGGWTEVRP